MTRRLMLSYVVCHAALAACETPSPSPPRDDRDAPYAELAQLYGEMGAECWPVSILIDGESASPTADTAARAQIREDLARAMLELLTADTVAVNSEVATACLEALRTRDGCAEIPLFGEPVACEGLTTGKQDEGEPCGTPQECSGELVCTGVDECGTCVTPPADGEACGANGLCGIGSRCDEGVCAPIPPVAPGLGIGEACPAAQSTCRAAEGLTCVGGVCELIGLVGPGEACDAARRCVDESTRMACLPTDEADPNPNPNAFVCKPLPGLGEPCAPSRLTPVPCDSTTAICDPTGQCVAGGQEGDPCSSDLHCLAGLALACHLDEGRCGPRTTFSSPAVCQEN
jgi:hypothetical protein